MQAWCSTSRMSSTCRRSRNKGDVAHGIARTAVREKNVRWNSAPLFTNPLARLLLTARVRNQVCQDKYGNHGTLPLLNKRCFCATARCHGQNENRGNATSSLKEEGRSNAELISRIARAEQRMESTDLTHLVDEVDR